MKQESKPQQHHKHFEKVLDNEIISGEDADEEAVVERHVQWRKKYTIPSIPYPVRGFTTEAAKGIFLISD
jgi:hypothetical protein